LLLAFTPASPAQAGAAGKAFGVYSVKARGFRVTRLGNLEKSGSAVHSSVAPCRKHSAAIRAS
jgi:hypothetical protein